MRQGQRRPSGENSEMIWNSRNLSEEGFSVNLREVAEAKVEGRAPPKMSRGRVPGLPQKRQL